LASRGVCPTDSALNSYRFSENSTFSITDMFSHMPKDALAKNFGVQQSAFDRIPREERFIFQAPLPPPLQADVVPDPSGSVPLDMRFKLMEQNPNTNRGGNVRIADTRNFPISTEIAAALVEVQPGHMREIHWHPNADEWQFYVAGNARMTVFGAKTNSRTFDYRAGDVGRVPKAMAHFVENTGDTPLRFLGLFRAPRFMDVGGAGFGSFHRPHHVRSAPVVTEAPKCRCCWL